MSEWKAKRFWKDATPQAEEGGFGVRLDGRPVRTPGKSLLVVPTAAMAEAIAAEWDAQGEMIDPLSMPITRAANSAIEKVTPQQAEVAAMLAEYAATDLLCYRADGPPELIARQGADWDPELDWAAGELGAAFKVAAGVMPVVQSDALMQAAHEVAGALPPFELTAFHDLVSIPGSFVLGLGLLRGRLSADRAFALSRIDEHWQAEQWGEDEEAQELEATKKAALDVAELFLALSRDC